MGIESSQRFTSIRRNGSSALEEFINAAIKRCRAAGYNPVIFIRMRHDLGTVAAISRLVRSPDIQYGFRELRKLDLLDFTIEAAVEKFPEEFDEADRKCASFRLREARRGYKRR